MKLNKYRSLYLLLKKGRSVSDPAKWKARQITATMLTGAIWAAIQAAGAYGYDMPVDEETVNGVAVGVLAIVNWVLTLSTSEKVGL